MYVRQTSRSNWLEWYTWSIQAVSKTLRLLKKAPVIMLYKLQTKRAVFVDNKEQNKSLNTGKIKLIWHIAADATLQLYTAVEVTHTDWDVETCGLVVNSSVFGDEYWNGVQLEVSTGGNSCENWQIRRSGTVLKQKLHTLAHYFELCVPPSIG